LETQQNDGDFGEKVATKNFVLQKSDFDFSVILTNDAKDNFTWSKLRRE